MNNKVIETAYHKHLGRPSTKKDKMSHIITDTATIIIQGDQLVGQVTQTESGPSYQPRTYPFGRPVLLTIDEEEPTKPTKTKKVPSEAGNGLFDDEGEGWVES
jgi:hypothetical protein